MKYLIATITLVSLIALFLIGYVWNHKTPIPAGCKPLEKKGCNGCALADSCPASQIVKTKDKEEDTKD